ncbi:MAG: SBBP repeat-containing protein [Candidatus Helarchaeota archaeon]
MKTGTKSFVYLLILVAILIIPMVFVIFGNTAIFISPYSSNDIDIRISANTYQYTKIWNKKWDPGSLEDRSADIAIDSNGNIYICGFINSFGNGSKDVALVKYDPSGNIQWYKT